MIRIGDLPNDSEEALEYLVDYIAGLENRISMLEPDKKVKRKKGTEMFKSSYDPQFMEYEIPVESDQAVPPVVEEQPRNRGTSTITVGDVSYRRYVGSDGSIQYVAQNGSGATIDIPRPMGSTNWSAAV